MASSSSGWDQGSANSLDMSATRIADATIAAARADYDAKVAELVADLEATRNEKEKAHTELAYLKASSRKERLQWNKERTLLGRKVAQAEKRARELGDGVASPEEFSALQEGLVSRDAIIEGLRKELQSKEAAEDKLHFQAVCESERDKDLDILMVRVASLEKELAKERDLKSAAQELAEAKSAEVRGLERRLAAAMESASRAESEAASCVQEATRAKEDVREARAAQRHAELWLEKSLAEVDAVHALLTFERSQNVSIDCVESPAPPRSAHPPSPEAASKFRESSLNGDHPTPECLAETPQHPTPSGRGGRLATPELDKTVPTVFSPSLLRAQPGTAGWEEVESVTPAGTIGGADGLARGEGFSPPTPTILFEDSAPDGGTLQVGQILQGPIANGSTNGNGVHEAAENLANGKGILALNGEKGVSNGFANGHAGDSSGAGKVVSPSSLLVWYSFVLRYEMSRREKAEARATKLESESTESNPSAAATGAGKQQVPVSAAQPSAAVADVDGDCYAYLVRLDQERQVKMILGLVREARVKMGWSYQRSHEAGAADGVSLLASRWERGNRENHREPASAGATDSSFEKRHRDLLDSPSPAEEVASLIAQFEGKILRADADNAQLQDFCTHLESLLAGEPRDARAGAIEPGTFVQRQEVFGRAAPCIVAFFAVVGSLRGVLAVALTLC